MIDFVWATDIHLDFLEDDHVVEWVKSNLQPKAGSAILITGDISLAGSLFKHLRMIREHSGKEVYFVLGNHDYWDGSISKLRSELSQLEDEGIRWLGNVDYVPFGEKLAVVGHDGWYDALYGDVRKSRFIMNDWFRISEYSGALHDVVSTSRKLAAEGARHVMDGIEKAIQDGREEIVVMTHFPPFAEACMYRGKRSEPSALPWYSSKLMGEILLKAADSNPDISITVLCGHTHSSVQIAPRPNLRVIVGNSDYGKPDSTSIGVSE